MARYPTICPKCSASSSKPNNGDTRQRKKYYASFSTSNWTNDNCSKFIPPSTNNSVNTRTAASSRSPFCRSCGEITSATSEGNGKETRERRRYVLLQPCPIDFNTKDNTPWCFWLRFLTDIFLAFSNSIILEVLKWLAWRSQWGRRWVVGFWSDWKWYKVWHKVL